MLKMLKTFVVYFHLLATCVAIGSVLMADHTLWSWRNRVLDEIQQQRLAQTQRVVTIALVFLWCSGFALVYLGYMVDGVKYLLNEKLWVKLMVVSLLTLNGVLLHKIGFPRLQRAAFTQLTSMDRVCLSLLGAVSTTSWLFAAFLGIARPWNYSLPYEQIIGFFGAVLLAAITGAVAISLLMSYPSDKSYGGAL